MPEARVLEKLQPIFRDVFDRPGLQVTPDDSAYTVEGWDSLMQVNLISAIEQDFGIRFRLGETDGLKNIGEMIELIVRKLPK